MKKYIPKYLLKNKQDKCNEKGSLKLQIQGESSSQSFMSYFVLKSVGGVDLQKNFKVFNIFELVGTRNS